MEGKLGIGSCRILEGDCVDLMAALPAGSVKMIFADPPYNLQLEGELRRPNNTVVDGVDAAWDRFDGFKGYDRFTRTWLEQARRVLADDGTIWVIGTYHNIYRVGTALQDLGFWVLNDVVWRKTNPMPNFRGRRFTNAHETLIWCAKSRGARYTFNYEAMKALNEDLQMRSDWLLPLCSGAERLRINGHKAHPTQKPEALLYRVILASTEVGDLVLDPFLGSGTSAAVAKKLGRRYLGIERERSYIKLAEARLAAIDETTDREVLVTPARRNEPRVPFGAVVERGLLVPGAKLFDERRRFQAKVGADGSLIASPHRGSIHRVGALLQGVPSCNGWQFWHYEAKDGPEPIDRLRKKIRSELRRL